MSGNTVKIQRKKLRRNLLFKKTRKHQCITRGNVFLPVLDYRRRISVHNGSSLCRAIDKSN